MPTTHILNSIKSGMELSIKYAELSKHKATPKSKQYYLAEGEINGIQGSISLIDMALQLIK